MQRHPEHCEAAVKEAERLGGILTYKIDRKHIVGTLIFKNKIKIIYFSKTPNGFANYGTIRQVRKKMEEMK